LRLVRALRMVKHFKVMWRLVYSLLTAGQTLMSATALVMLALFIFSCVAIEVITLDPDLRANPLIEPIVTDNFPSLFASILTLFQFVTLDSVAGIYYPIVMQKPGLLMFFVPILIIISIGLMNLVTAILVENALENAAIEAEAERLQLKQKIKTALPVLLDTFEKLDEDGSGSITKDEIENVPVSVLPAELLGNVSVDNMVDLFDLLDVDGGGQLNQNEFVEGLLNIVLLDIPISTIQTLRLLQSIKTLTTTVGDELHSLNDRLLEAGGHAVRI